ncbi:MAG: hypothetical protein EBT86_08025 [Actinobacteria bacterium]|nr:hypothetical protein [Actinomycetota bacterium]
MALHSGQVAGATAGQFSFFSFFEDIRTFLFGGISTFPLTIAGTFLLIGLMTANYAFLFFLIGFLIIVPITQVLLNWGFGTLFDIIGLPSNIYKVYDHDSCNLILPFQYFESFSVPRTRSDKLMTAVPGLWTSMIIFFFSYLITNGVALYTRESGNPGADPNKVGKRKSQAMTSIILTAFLGVVFIIFRYRLTGCDTLLGLAIALGFYGWLGYSWYIALSGIGEDRLSDLFGIANRLLDPNSTADQPVACVPMPKDGGQVR